MLQCSWVTVPCPGHSNITQKDNNILTKPPWRSCAATLPCWYSMHVPCPSAVHCWRQVLHITHHNTITAITPVSTLLTFCPPFPPALMKVTSRSLSGITSCCRCCCCSSSSGSTSTPAKLVCRNPLALKGELRTKRWVPFSPGSQQQQHKHSHGREV